MAKKILILSGSPRKQGNSDLLCDEFMRGALEAGHIVEKIRVQEKKVAYCTACYACRDTGNCAIKDDMAEVLNASQVQKLQEVLAKRLSENTVLFYTLHQILKRDFVVCNFIKACDYLKLQEKTL